MTTIQPVYPLLQPKPQAMPQVPGGYYPVGTVPVSGVAIQQPSPYLDMRPVWTDPLNDFDSFNTNPRPQKLNILYYNDIHGKPMKLARYVTAFRELAKQGIAKGFDVLSGSAGDNNIENNELDWEVETRLMDMMGAQFSAYGNHESDMGIHNFVLGEEHQKAHFTTLASNLKLPESNELWKLVKVGQFSLEPRVIQGKYGTYGLIGVTTPELDKYFDTDVDMQGLMQDDFERTCQIVQQQAMSLKQHGVNTIILVSHMGYPVEAELASMVDGIDVIVGGHSHDRLEGLSLKRPENHYQKKDKPNVVLSPSGQPVIIVQAGHGGNLIGSIELEMNKDGQVISAKNKLLPMHQFPNDPKAQAILEAAYGKPQKLAFINEAYDNERAPFNPGPLALFTADAMRKIVNSDIAIVRSGEVRDDLNKGWLTNHQLKYLMPFTDTAVRITLTGEEIWNAYSRSARETLKKEDPHPGLINASGLKVRLNRDLGTVESILVEQKDGTYAPLEFNKNYTVAMCEFVIRNGKEWPEFAHKPIEYDSKMHLRDVLLQGLKDAGAPDKPINLVHDDRMVITSLKDLHPENPFHQVPKVLNADVRPKDLETKDASKPVQTTSPLPLNGLQVTAAQQR